MRLEVKVKEARVGSYTRTWDMDQLTRYLKALMDDHGVSLTIHGADGTKVDVYPKCDRCGCYNTIAPLDGGLCEYCKGRE